MNKRGDITLWQELVKAIPAVFLVLLLVFAGVQIYKATHPEKYSTEKKDLLRIVNEIKDLKELESGNKDDVIVPLFSRDYIIQGVNAVEQEQKIAYPNCNLDYCVCFLSKDTLVVCETFNLRKEFDTNDRCKKDGTSYKGVYFDASTKPSTNSPVKITRSTTSDPNKPCLITIQN